MTHLHEDIRKTRIDRFVSRLGKSVLGDQLPFDARYARTQKPVPWAERERLEYRSIREGEKWGETWDSAWFELKATVPPSWSGGYVVARIDFAGEALLFDDAGVPKLGLTNGSVFDGGYKKDVAHLLPRCKGGEQLTLWVEAAANGLFGVDRPDPEHLEDQSRLHGHYEGTVRAIRLHQFDYAAWQLWLDADYLLNLYCTLPEQSVRKPRLLRGLNKVVDAYSKEGVDAARSAIQPLLDVPADPSSLEVVGVGHAHIDTGWLWPVRETIRKCARTFANQLGLIERYPDYVFGASQAQHYAFCKEHYPELYAKIKKAVADGRWEVQGGMWVEADNNLISGESMVRQLVHGKHFFMNEFGVDVKNLWLPDVFGYSANLPQILSKAGCDYFLTQKLSWSRYNKFPHHTFIWQGIDGSEVLAHFPPEDNYNSPLKPNTLVRVDREYRERAICNEAISLFGIGDGGGGPKEEHIEYGLRARNLNGLPRFRFGAAQPVLEKLATYRDDLSTWVGELYLEAHRGTLTTQADVKRCNRRLEEALRATEMLCAAAGLEHYPQAELDAVWKKLLINQFHDIIPGSSIHMVYEQTLTELKEGLATCEQLVQEAAARLASAKPGALSVFNPSSSTVRMAVPLPSGWGGARGADSAQVISQRETETAVAMVTVQPCSAVTLSQAEGGVATETPNTDDLVLENELVRYELNEHLQIVRAFDKQVGREILQTDSKGNVLSLYEDRPVAWDAWDVDEFYEEEHLGEARADGKPDRISGPVRVGLRTHLSVGAASRIEQAVWLCQDSKRLDFKTKVNWHENHRMLRTSFPARVHANEASFEVQYGFLKRPTHTNTLWDHAKFEVVAHRWVDISERSYGVALLNDSKYGHKVRGQTLDLNLLRAPTEPDPIADRGSHEFTYSLLPHQGDLFDSDVAVHAACLNQGLTLLPDLELRGGCLPVQLEGLGLELAVLKKAEAEDCLVVRIAETRGVPSKGKLIAQPGARIVPTNLIEWQDDEANAKVGSFDLSLKAFELATFKLYR